MKKFFLFTVFFTAIVNVNGQNIGIGTTAPVYKLDVAGRLRIQNSSGTAGIYFDGITLPTRSFIGTLNDDHVGLYGSGGAGWNFVMNVENGNIGIGNALPTATLDVNGSFRLRGNIAKGSSLVSNDAAGNAIWQTPIAFNVRGYSSGEVILFPNDTWQDINFGTNVAYNYGGGYNSNSSEFVAPRLGIYNFKSQLQFVTTYIIKRGTKFCSQRIMVRRNGVTWVAGLTQYEIDADTPYYDYASFLDIDLLLEAGDAVWIEAKSIDDDGTDTRQILGNGNYTWISGRLVQPL